MADLDLASLQDTLRSLDKSTPEGIDADEVVQTARTLVSEGRGILAADESTGTLSKRFQALGIDTAADSRRDYRQMLLTTPGLGDHISGVILYDETIRQNTSTGTPFTQVLRDQGIVPGIKVDTGTKPLAGHPGEEVTSGLEGLRDRLAEYREFGARFAKWRAVIRIGDGLPSEACLDANAHAMARYAAVAQEYGIVPIVEPEVLMNGDHGIAEDEAVTEAIVKRTFDQCYRQGVRFEGMLLKVNMVLPGKGSSESPTPEEVAGATLRVMRRTVPAALPGIVFLSGGQSALDSTVHLNAMNQMGPHPWRLSFSYARALQGPAMETWAGNPDNVERAQRIFAHRARCNGAASTGTYKPEMEEELAA